MIIFLIMNTIFIIKIINRHHKIINYNVFRIIALNRPQPNPTYKISEPEHSADPDAHPNGDKLGLETGQQLPTVPTHPQSPHSHV